MGTYKELEAMADFGIIRLDWEVDSSGYYLEEIPEGPPGTILSGLTSGLCIKPRGGRKEAYTARLRERNIFLDLANMDKSPDGALAFVHKWGPLNVPSIGTVEETISASEMMERRLNRVKQGDARLNHERWRFRLEGEFRGREVIVRVKSLRAFCWLEFLQAHSAGGDFSQCANPKCGAWRRYPVTGRPNKYCSDACKKAAQRAKKKIASST